MNKTTKQWLWFVGLYIAAVAVYAAVEFAGHAIVGWLT